MSWLTIHPSVYSLNCLSWSGARRAGSCLSMHLAGSMAHAGLTRHKINQRYQSLNRKKFCLVPTSWGPSTWPTEECYITSVVFVFVHFGSSFYHFYPDCLSLVWVHTCWAWVAAVGTEPLSPASHTESAFPFSITAREWGYIPTGTTHAALKMHALKALWMKALSKWQLWVMKIFQKIPPKIDI